MSTDSRGGSDVHGEMRGHDHSGPSVRADGHEFGSGPSRVSSAPAPARVPFDPFAVAAAEAAAKAAAAPAAPAPAAPATPVGIAGMGSPAPRAPALGTARAFAGCCLLCTVGGADTSRFQLDCWASLGVPAYLDNIPERYAPAKEEVGASNEWQQTMYKTNVQAQQVTGD